MALWKSEICQGIDHNSLDNLNVGDYQHLTAQEKIDAITPVGAIGDALDPLYDLPLKNSLTPVVGIGSVTMIRAGAATHIDRYGVVNDLLTGVPGYDANGVDLPPASENICLYSRDLSNAAWVKTRSSIVAGVDGPDGVSASSWKLQQTTDVSTHYIYSSRSGVDTTVTQTLSAIVKAGEVLSCSLMCGDPARSNAFYALFDLDAGEVTSSGVGGDGSLLDTGITPISDEWYVIWITGIPESVDTGTIRYDIELIGESDLNNTDGLYIWHFQLEELPFATPPIFTEATTVARLGATIEFPYAENFPGSLKDKTVVFDVAVIGVSGFFANVLISYDLYMRLSNGFDLDATYVTMGAGSITATVGRPSDIFRFAITYAPAGAGTLRMYHDGVLVVENTTAPGSLDPAAVIALGDGALYVKIKNLRVYDKAFDEATMRTL